MALSRTSVSRLTRVLLVASVAAAPIVMASPASASTVISRADFSAGNLTIVGVANAGRTITVDGVAMATTTISSGSFTINRSGYTPPADCTVDINDGSFTASTIRLNGCTPTVATAAMLPDRAELGPFTAGVSVTGNAVVSFAGSIGPDSWQIVGGALPTGVRMIVPQPTQIPKPNPPQQLTYIQLAGTPTTAGTGTVTFRATDSRGDTATRTYTVTVNPAVPVAITPQPWSPATVGEFTNLWIDGSGGVLPYSWAVTAGALPPGMTLIQDSLAGPSVRVGGTPTTAGTFTWTLKLTDAHALTTTRTFTATVADPATPVADPTPTPTPQPAPAFMSIESLMLNPASVDGGTSSTGTVTVSTAAPAGGTSVFLASSDPAVASVPATVTVPEGATSATFPLTTAVVPFTRSATIDATYAGTLQAKLTVNAAPVPNADAVSISRVEYDTAKRQLRVEATSTGSGAVLRVYFTGTDTLIGTLSGGSGQFNVSVNPLNITIRSSLGGTAAQAVTAK